MGENKRKEKDPYWDFGCDKKEKREKCCDFCFTSIEASIHSRNCFMTGEHCSKQSRIQHERQKLYDEKCITAFVIMNFSDMSDVFYKWRLRSFIESLTKYLYMDVDNKRLYCNKFECENKIPEKNRIKKIQVIRSDSDPASNYVICSRICQQIQIADLVIVDVSSQNANVFYEFGIAVALGKMILPICYSESYFNMVIPDKFKKKYEEMAENERQDLEKHIGFYPWRKDLFEYYGIRYRQHRKIKYLEFEKIKNAEYGFSDIKYTRFPYHEPLSGEREITGKVIYDILKENYNKYHSNNNTLIVYTMDAFLNEEQAGRCIVNFYQSITARMRQEKCFCGERVGVLVQENVIMESEKDSKEQLDIFYNVGEIIQIGVNQATYLAAEERIREEDNFRNAAILDIASDAKPTERQRYDIERFVKGHIKNRAMRIYPNNPVFVDRMENVLHKDLLISVQTKENEVCNCCQLDFFCLYHVMLRTLRYTNEVVVDISNNCLQSLFWLGVAHGSDVYAITVIYEKTDKEKNLNQNKVEKESRYVFDVAGLWMAILRKNDTERFYEQLVQAQNGIERNSKLMLPDSRHYKRQMHNYLFAFDEEIDLKDEKNEEPESVRRMKENEEKNILESYYRDHFWTPMLVYNKLSIYISQFDDFAGENQEPKLCTGSWDFDAISVLSHYLSKKKVIGEYTLSSRPHEKGSEKSNFISIGSFAKEDLPEDIYKRIQNEPEFNTVYTRIEWSPQEEYCGANKKDFYFKGFEKCGDKNQLMVTHQPKINNCAKCPNIDKDYEDAPKLKVIHSKDEVKKYTCNLRRNSKHYEIAQLILWREDPDSIHGHSNYWVGIIGCSGPATYALSTLFIDKAQKASCFKLDNNSRENTNDNLLCELQSNIREKFMNVFFKKLQLELDRIKLETSSGREITGIQKIRYFGLVKYAVASYLHTVLYKYFFPFLSEKDIDCIYNGVYTFENSMNASKVSPFAFGYSPNADEDFRDAISNRGVKVIADKILEVLLSCLKNFKGFEAFYVVEVEHHLDDKMNFKDLEVFYKTEAKQRLNNRATSIKDTRSIVNIQMMYDDNAVPRIDYFFVS